MKAKDLYEKIENVCTFKNGNHKKDYWCIVRMLKGKKATHHYQCYRRGFLVVDKVPEMLTAIGIDYAIGNDAPRGGVTGNYVYLTAKGKRQIRELAKSDFYKNF